MAAYAALVSLSHILHQILHPPPTHHFTNIPSERVGTLQEKVNFLIDFLETYPTKRSQEIQDVEKQITDAAYEAEDIIESEVVTQIQSKHPQKTSFAEEIKKILRIRNGFSKKKIHKHIPNVIKKFISIQKELVEIRNRKGMEDLIPYSARPHPSGMDIMVGFHEHLNQIRIALASSDSRLRVIPIVGMGGIGKTTLATNVYKDPYIVEYFDIHAWVRVSQEYRERDLVLALLEQINRNSKTDEMSAEELGNLVHKTLFGRRYFIVLDDMWDIQAWDELKWFLPDNNNGSRILVTTRLLKLGVDLGSCSPYQINLLNEQNSWDLILEKVFGKEECPDELEKIGKSIARKCGGLPLALVVMGGLLAKLERKAQYWHSIAQDVASAVNNEDNHHMMKLLSLSYSHLPINLKPCFLYLAAFPEDYEINVSRLVRLWVAEGLIKMTEAKSLEEVAEDYLEDLIDRNLVLVGRRGSSGKVKTCKMHDLLRDLCMREAHKGKFLCIAKVESHNISPYMGRQQRRMSIHYVGTEEKVWKALQSANLNRSLLSYSHKRESGQLAQNFRLLRVLDVVEGYVTDQILQKINLRYVCCTLDVVLNSASRLWNLQTLVIDGKIRLPAQIWKMTQLRHIKITEAYLHDPPPDTSIDNVVLENLQTLLIVKNFKCSEQIVSMVPNLKKLGIAYGFLSKEYGPYCLSNLVFLRKLKSLRIRGDQRLWGDISFPSSLNKLILSFCNIPWEDMSMIGSLPNLEVLKLFPFAAKGHEWRPNEGDFSRLKFLLIYGCRLEIWEADNTHFPRLERLYLRDVGLEEIPMEFAEIPTLQVIGTNMSSFSSLWISANEISEQRESLGYEALQLVCS